MGRTTGWSAGLSVEPSSTLIKEFVQRVESGQYLLERRTFSTVFSCHKVKLLFTLHCLCLLEEMV